MNGFTAHGDRMLVMVIVIIITSDKNEWCSGSDVAMLLGLAFLSLNFSTGQQTDVEKVC